MNSTSKIVKSVLVSMFLVVGSLFCDEASERRDRIAAQQLATIVDTIATLVPQALDRMPLVERKLGTLEDAVKQIQVPLLNDMQRLSYVALAVDQAIIPLAESFLVFADPVLTVIDSVSGIVLAFDENNTLARQTNAFAKQLKELVPLVKPILKGAQDAFPKVMNTLDRYGGRITA